jgi:hypothetical protein
MHPSMFARLPPLDGHYEENWLREIGLANQLLYIAIKLPA